MFPPRRELPVKFHAVKLIRSVEIRTRLTHRITVLLELLSFLEAYELSPKTKTLVTKFFVYLTDSCKSPEVMNQRCIWLYEYGGIVEDHLAILEERFRRRSSFVEQSPNEDLINAVIALVEAISLYRVTARQWFENDLGVLDILDTIIDRANRADPQHDALAYGDLQQRIYHVAETIMAMVNAGVVSGIDYEYALLAKLMEIRHRLVRYTMWHGYISS